MKKCLVCCCSFFVLSLSAQTFSKDDFFYTIPLKIQDNDFAQSEWWHEQLPPSTHHTLLQSILNLVDSGRISVYNPTFPYSEKLTPDAAHLLLHKTDTVYLEYGYLYDVDYVVEHHDLKTEDIVSLSFHEEWKYDSIAKTFIKNVKGLIINCSNYSTSENWLSPLFYIPFDGKGIKGGNANSNPIKISGITYDFHTSDFYNFLQPAEFLFADDTNMREKSKAEVNMLIRSSLAGKKLSLYDTLYPYYKTIDKKNIKSRLPVFQSADAIRFFEDWSIDLNKMTFTKAVHGIVLEKENHFSDPDGTRVSFSRLAFVPLNGFAPSPPYYPNTITVPNFIYRKNIFDSQNTSEQQTNLTDSVKLMSLCIGVCDLVESQKLHAFNYDYEAFVGEKKDYLTKHYTDSLFDQAHKAIANPKLYNPNYSFISFPYYYQNTGGFGFRENWTYNSSTQEFEKEIKTITLISLQYLMYKEGNYLMPLFCVDLPPIKDTAAILKPEFLIGKNIQSPVLINHVSEKSEEERYFAPYAIKNESAMDPSIRYNIIQQIISAGLQGKMKVYDGVNTNLPLTPMQLKTKIDSLKDSTFISNDLPTDYLLFQEIIFVEDWYFNPATGEFYKKVNELIFVNTSDDITSYNIDFERQKRVFSIKLN